MPNTHCTFLSAYRMPNNPALTDEVGFKLALYSGNQVGVSDRPHARFQPRDSTDRSSGITRRRFLKCVLIVSIWLGIFGIPASSIARSAREVMYVGVWRGGLGNVAERVNGAANWSSFVAENEKHIDEGLRLVAIGSYYDFDARESKYCGVWRGGHGKTAQVVGPEKDWNTFAAKNQQFVEQGLRLIAISVSNAGGQLRYVGVWRGGQGNAAQRVHPAMEWSAFTAQDKKYFDQGLRLAAVSTTYNVEGEPVYAGVWRGGLGNTAQRYYPVTDWNTFSARANKLHDQGLRITAISAYYKSGEPKYFGVWRGGQGSASEWVHPAVDGDAFGKLLKKYIDQGLRLVGIAIGRDQSTRID